MTEYEIADLAQAQFDRLVVLLDVLGTHLSIYLTIISGFLVVAYLVGNKLSRSQITMISLLYLAATTFEALLIMAMSKSIIDIVSFLDAYDDKINDTLFQILGAQYLGLFVLVSAMLMPLWFMWSVRRKKQKPVKI